MDKVLIQKILDGRKELKSLPQTLSEVVRLSHDDNASAGQLATILSRDPMLTTKVLRIVNSPFYSLPSKVSSLTQAVMTIGMKQVTALALSSSVYSLTSKVSTGIDRLRFWRHSLETAIACRMIAEKIKYRNPEELYVAGLVHDIGLLILEGAFPAEFPRVWMASGREGNLVDLEEEIWGTNHALVGQFLLDQWHLPESISLAVGRHHTVFTPHTTHPELVPSQVLSLANQLSRFSLYINSRPPAREEQEAREILRDNLGLSEEDLRVIEKSLFSKTIEEARYLEIEVGSTEEILMEANRLLFDQYVTVESVLRENRQMQQQINRDQIRLVSNDTLREAMDQMAQQISTAITLISSRAEFLRSEIGAGSVVDSQNTLHPSSDAIIESVKAIRAVLQEMTVLTNSCKLPPPDRTMVAAMENRLEDYASNSSRLRTVAVQ
ncbi:MAG: HDOD domain-containing protein [candidate division Zixibacteria bacterium]|nr:HDOD domain-containing protein [candidate division Zixibacteria bacterium]